MFNKAVESVSLVTQTSCKQTKEKHTKYKLKGQNKGALMNFKVEVSRTTLHQHNKGNPPFLRGQGGALKLTT